MLADSLDHETKRNSPHDSATSFRGSATGEDLEEGGCMEFEHFEHGADIGVRGFGATPAEAFVGAAQALFSLLAERPSSVRAAAEERIEVEAPGLEELLVAYLNELISLADARRLVFGEFSVEIEGGGARPYRLSARARGEPFDPDRHEWTVQPKGATYTSLRVAREGERWVAQCVVDV
jgi:SHS2 domain-containing protein